jgi:hypothetical protein
MWSDCPAFVAEAGYIISKGIFPNYNYELAAGNIIKGSTISTGTTCNGNLVGIQSSITFNTNTWYFVVVTNDGSTLKIYFDAEFNGSLSISLPQTNNNDVYIGRYEGDDRWYFKGKIDDIRIYNRALTEIEIQNLYNE